MCLRTFPEHSIQRHAERCKGVEEEPSRNCGLCNKRVSISGLFALDECSHMFCRGCIEQHIGNEVVTRMAVNCPTCGAHLSVRDCKTLIPHKSALRKPKDPTRRLMEEFRYLQSAGTHENGFSVELVGDNLFEWEAKFFGFDLKTEPIAMDLKKASFCGGVITLRLVFPQLYPLAPPYVRVLRPRFMHMTGHITIGGSVCFEMLTSDGWQPQFTVESMLVSIRTNIVAGGARIDFSNHTDFSEAEARTAFDRMMKAHGWR